MFCFKARSQESDNNMAEEQAPFIPNQEGKTINLNHQKT